jgi:hypothetical protein
MGQWRKEPHKWYNVILARATRADHQLAIINIIIKYIIACVDPLHQAALVI